VKRIPFRIFLRGIHAFFNLYCTKKRKYEVIMRKTIAMILLTAMMLAGCNGATDNPVSDASVTFMDDLGREVTVDNPKRVAALLGSFADVWVLAGGTLCAAAEDAWEDFGLVLDDAVNLGGAHSPSLELLLSADPDFVLASSTTASNLEFKDTLEAAGIAVAYFDVKHFDDYLRMLDICTAITGREDLYEKNGLQVKAHVDGAIAAASAHGGGSSVLLLRAYSGGVKAKNSDNTAGVMLRDLGCVNIADSDSSLLEDLQMEAILAAAPEYIFVTTMGADPEKALASLQALFDSDPAWQSLDAVKCGRIHVLEKELFHYKPNVRWGESYEILAGILYPEQ
jgi:iron complex transport system substrate-binding protein